MKTKFTIKYKQVVEEEVSFNKFIAIRIKDIRIKKGMNQDELADLLGMSRTSISNIEQGRQQISIKRLYQICTKLDVKSSEILPF